MALYAICLVPTMLFENSATMMQSLEFKLHVKCKLSMLLATFFVCVHSSFSKESNTYMNANQISIHVSSVSNYEAHLHFHVHGQ